jgi:hypothetical protein
MNSETDYIQTYANWVNYYFNGDSNYKENSVKTLNNYWVSGCKWDGNDLEVSLSPCSRPRYIIKVHDDNSINEVLKLMHDGLSNDFKVDVSNNTITYNGHIIKFNNISNQGK